MEHFCSRSVRTMSQTHFQKRCAGLKFCTNQVCEINQIKTLVELSFRCFQLSYAYLVGDSWTKACCFNYSASWKWRSFPLSWDYWKLLYFFCCWLLAGFPCMVFRRGDIWIPWNNCYLEIFDLVSVWQRSGLKWILMVIS